MSVTFEEIARLAGVSKATVSRVVNNSPNGVGEKTRARVLQIIQELETDTANLNTRSGARLKTIGLIIPDITNPFFAEMAKEIGKAAMEHGYSIYLGNTDFSVENECRYIKEFVAKQVSGIILLSFVKKKYPEHDLIEKYKIPCVVVNNSVENMTNVSEILVDHTYATYNCCRLLIQNGAKNIAYISSASTPSSERFEGYCKALEENGIQLNESLLQQGDYTLESGYNAILNLEKTGIKYDAIIATNDLVAMGCLKALKELDYQIPEDMQVIGYDNIEFARYADPSLTTVQQPTMQMAQMAVEDLLNAIQKGTKRKKAVHIQGKLLRRQTTK